ncbi:hypothetical protein [Micromonospora sp. NPDC049102]|uniref:hypothetical protein n=1 Tax=Micromonospora sp. NPDC049102 TaxID=3364265 RepID=UPI003714D6D5
MSESGSIVDPDGYASIRSHAATVFHLDARLPDQVFRADASDSLFCEFDSILVPEFWPAFCAAARWHGDERIELLVLEPDGEAYFVPKYGLYPAISLPVEAGEDDYWAAIGTDPPGHNYSSMALSANVVAVTGPSGKWGCWGERGYEVAVFRGFPNAATRSEWQAQFGPLLDVSDAVNSFFPWTFRRRAAPDGYVAALTANYGGGEDA